MNRAQARAMNQIAMDWNVFKHSLSPWLGVSQDALHVISGVLIQLGAAAIVRRSLAHPVPWLVVAALEAANEYSDLRLEDWPDRTVQLNESWKDIAVTLLLPTILFLVARFAPTRLAGRRS